MLSNPDRKWHICAKFSLSEN